MFSPATTITLRKAIEAPLLRALLLSVCLHLALLGLVQVAPVSYEASMTVIQVRLPAAGLAERETQQHHAAEPIPLPALQPMPDKAQALSSPAERVITPAMGGGAPAQAAKAEPLAVPSVMDLRWYGAREVDGHPKAISPIEPVYPEAARRRGQTGWVKLRLKIDEFGGVKEAEVVEAMPVGVFDAATLQAFEQARFEPARKQGRPVRYEGYFRVVFELD